jgi:excisionase family DNA binding protein
MNTEQDATEKWHSTKYVAELLSVTPETIRDWIASGKIAGKKINNLWRVPTSEIRRMLNEG